VGQRVVQVCKPARPTVVRELYGVSVSDARKMILREGHKVGEIPNGEGQAPVA
jgi:hypothetical protein